MDFAQLFSTPQGWLVALGAVILLALIWRFVGALVRLVAILLSVAGIVWVFIQFSHH